MPVHIELVSVVRDARMAKEFLPYVPIMIANGCLAKDGKAESRLREEGRHDWLIMSARSTKVGNCGRHAMYLPSLIKET